MTSTTPDELFDPILARTLTKQREAAVAIAADVKKRIGVPVEYVGGKTIRSKRGEPPRKDTGALQESIDAESVAKGDSIETAIYTDRRYAPRLEGEMNRPIMTDRKNKYAEDVAKASADAFTGD